MRSSMHSLNSTKTVAVATDYYWLPIDADTPRGVKIQLLGVGGVANYATYRGELNTWTHWAPLPRKKDAKANLE